MFFLFRQTNSGGTFDFDPLRGISVEVCIQADSAEEAIQKAENIGIYFDGVRSGIDCSCCGDRWYEPWANDATEKQPTHVRGYTKWIVNGPEGFVHLNDGTIIPLGFVQINY